MRTDAKISLYQIYASRHFSGDVDLSNGFSCRSEPDRTEFNSIDLSEGYVFFNGNSYEAKLHAGRKKCELNGKRVIEVHISPLSNMAGFFWEVKNNG